MASSKKLIINNLTIVWQGQSWSIITPDGTVKARFPDKNDAIRYAEQTLDFKERKISLDELMPLQMNGEEYVTEQELFREFLEFEVNKPEKAFITQFLENWPY